VVDTLLDDEPLRLLIDLPETGIVLFETGLFVFLSCQGQDMMNAPDMAFETTSAAPTFSPTSVNTQLRFAPLISTEKCNGWAPSARRGLCWSHWTHGHSVVESYGENREAACCAVDCRWPHRLADCSKCDTRAERPGRIRTAEHQCPAPRWI